MVRWWLLDSISFILLSLWPRKDSAQNLLYVSHVHAVPVVVSAVASKFTFNLGSVMDTSHRTMCLTAIRQFSIVTTIAPVAVHTDRCPRYAGQNGIEPS